MKSIVISISLTLAMLAGSLQGDALENQVKVQLRGNAMANAPVIETVRLYRKSYALVIGIDNYHKGWPRLSGAVKDANMVANVLRANGFNVELRLNLNSLELNKTLKTFFAIKGKAPDSRLFLWYAGHGHTVNGEGYLVPADAPDPNSDQFLVNALPMRDFGSLTRLANSKHVLSVFDSCFSGTVFQTRGGPVSATITRKTTLPVREFITSGDAGQQVRDDGSFRNYFLRAINGDPRADSNHDGYLTGEELGLYLSQEISALTNDTQTPRAGKLQDARFNQGDFVFVLPPSNHQTNKPVNGSNTALLEIEYWKSIQASRDVEPYQLYLRKFPQGHFSDLAQLKLKQLNLKKALEETDVPATNVSKPAYMLSIEAMPYDATIRIMNIKQKYHPGIRLEEGRYHIMVTKPGFKSYNHWLKIVSNDINQSVKLHRLEPGIKSAPLSISKPKKAKKAVAMPTFITPAMVRVPAGTLKTGARIISFKPFLIGKYEVLFSEFDEFCNQTGRTKPKDKTWGRYNRPVIYVNYEDASEYAAWLSLKTGKKFRLPSETEWLYAALSGSKTDYPWGNSAGENHANCDSCKSAWKNQTAPAGSFQPNAFGLYDMQGNVWEWTAGCWRNDFSMLPDNGSPNITGNCYQRSLRGGSWHHSYKFMKASYRLRNLKSFRSETTGFRVVQEINP